MHKSILSFLIVCVCLCSPLSLWAEDDSALGVASGLSGEVTNNVTPLPSAPQVNVPSAVRPLIILPPESYEPHTLVAPLQNEPQAAQVYRRHGVETVQPHHPMMPKNSAGTRHTGDENAEDNGQTVKTRVLAPAVY